jgi:hypothetical protein
MSLTNVSINMDEETKTSDEPQAIKGSGKGKIGMSDDFDAPLEELKEYTE